MIALIGDHVWQSTLVAIAAGVLACALRANRAEVRYWIWLAASVKFLIPFAALTAIGGAIGSPWATPVARPEIALVIDAVSQPFFQPLATAGPPAPEHGGSASPLVPAVLLFVVWFGGVVTVLAVWWVRWRRVTAIARAGHAMTAGREFDVLRGLGGLLPLVACDGSLEPGVFGIVRPVLLWPRGISARLTDEQIEAILAHEIAHLRRRDNFTAAMHMAAQALFWFHPLVWWIGARLVHERERACDEAVLQAGNEPEVYAESILRTCEYSVESPLACISGVTGADLTRRIETIMGNRAAMALSSGKWLLLSTAGLAILVGPVLAGGVNARPLPSQGNVAADEKLVFDVTSIKPNDTGAGRISMRFLPGASYEATNVTLKALVQQAYRMSERQVIGGPAWLETDRFDILATSPPGAVQARFPERLQALLVDRLNLKAHRETRDMPIYALVLARTDGSLGPRIRKSPLDCSPGAPASARGRANVPPPAVAAAGDRQQTPMPAMAALGTEPRPCSLMIVGNRLSVGGTTMAGLADMLQNTTGRIVEDRTGLSGTFDFDLELTPDPALRGRGPGGGLPPRAENTAGVPDPDGVSIFTAVQEQLGLRLESVRGLVDVLVIDSADRPAEN